MGATRQQVHLDELRRIDLCPLTVAEVAEQHLGPPPRTKLATVIRLVVLVLDILDSSGTVGSQAPLIPYPTVSNLVDVVLSLKEAGNRDRCVHAIHQNSHILSYCGWYHEGQRGFNQLFDLSCFPRLRVLSHRLKAEVFMEIFCVFPGWS